MFFSLGVIFFLFIQSVGAFPFSLEDNFAESSCNIYVMSYNSVFVLFRLTLGKVSFFSTLLHFVPVLFHLGHKAIMHVLAST